MGAGTFCSTLTPRTGCYNKFESWRASALPAKCCMPKDFVQGPHKFFFYSNEGNEPMHLHIRSGSNEAKFWVQPVEFAYGEGFRDHELNEIRRIVEARVGEIRNKWNEHFSNS